MNIRTAISLLILAGGSLPTLSRADERTMTIGVVTDGPSDEWALTQTIFFKELQALTENEVTLRFPESKQRDGAWSVATITETLRTLDADPDVDMVLALGYTASRIASLQLNSRKPTFAPFMANASLSGVPFKNGVSGVRNVNYLASDLRFSDEIVLFRRVRPFTRMAILIDQTLFEAIPALTKDASDRARAAGVQVSFVTDTGDGRLVSKIAPETEAVMIAPLPRISKTQQRALFNELNQRRLLTFSLMGSDEVREGVLMAGWSSSDIGRLARQTALNMQAVMRGEAAGDQPVAFERRRQVTMNMATARMIGFSPNFDLMKEAVLLNEDNVSGPALSLSEAAHEAVRANLEIIAGQLSVQAGAYEITQARSVLFPQIQATVDGYRRKNDSPFVARGLAAEESLEGSLALQQLLFSERAIADLAIQKRLQLSREAQQRTLELDIVRSATNAFLDILTAKTQMDIQKNGVRLAQANWQMAKDRVEVGKADISDVYRWESEIANSRQRLLNARARHEQARDRLNRLLHRPLGDRYVITPAALTDPIFFISRAEFFPLIDNEAAFSKMSAFFVREGLRLSPELASIDREIEAQRRLLRSEQAGHVLPRLQASVQGSRVMADRWAPSSTLELEGTKDWRVGLNASLPLFEGGGRVARSAQARRRLEQLRAQRAATRESVEEGVRASLHALRSSYPAIELSAQAAQAASKTFELVRKNYGRGTRSVVELLDAQNASLAADQTAANAVFVALSDLMNLQRRMSRFDFFANPAQQDEWMNHLKTYLKESAS